MEGKASELDVGELKSLKSIKGENSLKNETQISLGLSQGQLGGHEKSSTDGSGKPEKFAISLESRQSYNTRRTNLNINGTQERGPVGTGKQRKEEVGQKESKCIEVNNNSSNVSKLLNGAEMETHTSGEINSSPSIYPSSSGIKTSPQNHLERENIKKTLKETYNLLPKSKPSSVNVNSNLITVKFEFENNTFASALNVTATIDELKNELCDILELEEDSITLLNDNIEVKASQTLSDIGGLQESKIVFKILSNKGESGNALLRSKVQENIPTIDVITVHLGEAKRYKNVVVGIENESIQKQWLGGYRNRLTGTEYHNADTQTEVKKRALQFDEDAGTRIPLFYNRDTQTPFPLKQKMVDTVVNKGTQMSRCDLYIASKEDKIMIARPYKTGINLTALHMHDKRFVNLVVTIQRAVRKWRMRKRFTSLIDSQIQQLRIFKSNRQNIIKDQEAKDLAVITGTAYPVNRDDFYALFLRVEKWWKKEWKRICETKIPESKKVASVMLMEKETELLKSIEKHKVASKSESLKREQMSFLEQISRPTLFRSSKGHLTTIDYLKTQKAREFKEIYSALARKDILFKDRIEILITMKRLFESHYMEYEYAADLVSLINREIELIGIGIKLKDLKGLQSRIEQLFMNFLQQTEFNPSVEGYKKPNLPKTIHQTFKCSRCLELFPASKYPVHVRMTSLNLCTSCTWMENIAHKRADMSPYIKLLHQIQNSEMQKCCHSALCFILQPIGMGFLTNVIWNGHSAISECSDVSKLKHVRWLPGVEWAPWNTILLTDQEAKLHESIPDIFTFYNEKFIDKVQQRHITARKTFIQLLMMDNDIRTSGQWSKITDSGDFLHKSHAVRMATQDTDYDKI